MEDIKNAVIDILDKFYTPWYKINMNGNTVVIATEHTLNCCIPFPQNENNLLWYLETFICNRQLNMMQRFRICGYFSDPEELASQVLSNIQFVETEIYVNTKKQGGAC